MTLMIITASVLICLIERLYLVPKGMKKELTAVIIISAITVFLQIGSGLGLSTPIGLIQKLFEPIGRTLFNRL